MRKLSLAALILVTLGSGMALPQHVCEETGQVVCPEGQTYNPETAKCEAPVSS